MTDILKGRWQQLRGRMKRLLGDVTGDEVLKAEGNVDVATGTLQEGYGVAKREASRKLTRGIDAVASRVRRAAKAISR